MGFEELIHQAVEAGKIKWLRHALQRMMERDIFREHVKHILLEGEVIEEYVEDHPFPSALFFGYIEKRPLHVISSIDKETKVCYIVTAYHPDLDHFETDFKTRK